MLYVVLIIYIDFFFSRKPQNLTPPGSSDGGSSVGSGQSPSSVHPGSPPSAIEPPPSSKRPIYDGALPTKRQRISRVPICHSKPAIRSDPASVHKLSSHLKGGGDGGGGGGGGISFNSSSNILGNSANGPNRYGGSGVRWSPSPTPGTANTEISSNHTSSIPSRIDHHLNLSSSPVIESKERKQHSSSVSSSLSLSVSSSSPSLSSSFSSSSSALPRPTSTSSNIYENRTEPKYVM